MSAPPATSHDPTESASVPMPVGRDRDLASACSGGLWKHDRHHTPIERSLNAIAVDRLGDAYPSRELTKRALRHEDLSWSPYSVPTPRSTNRQHSLIEGEVDRVVSDAGTSSVTTNASAGSMTSIAGSHAPELPTLRVNTRSRSRFREAIVSAAGLPG